jgi:hypothetical protein
MREWEDTDEEWVPLERKRYEGEDTHEEWVPLERSTHE